MRRLAHLISLCLLTCLAASAQTTSLTFSSQSAGATSAGSIASVSGDFNGDGKLDVAIAQGGLGSVAILLGKGNGTFATAVSYPVPNCVPSYLVTGDFKKDGKLDVLGTCSGQPLFFVLPGNGDGTFGAAIETTTPQHMLSGLDFIFVGPLAVGDFNGDGQLDLALILISGQDFKAVSQFPESSLAIYQGTGDGTFTAAATTPFLPTGQMPVEALAVDLNGDGQLDLAGVAITPGPSSNRDVTSVYLWSAICDGHGNFQLVTDSSIDNLPLLGISAADVNGDGVPDIILAGPDIALNTKNTNLGTSSVSIELGNGDGTFHAGFAQVDPSGFLGVMAWPVDLQGTGLPDLVEIAGLNAQSGNISSTSIGLRANNGDGTFGPPQTLSSTSFLPFAFAFGDFNGDGRTDIQVDALEPGAQINEKSSTDLAQVIEKLPPGLNEILLNTTPAVKFDVVDAASFAPGPVATGSIVAAFGTALATSTAAAESLPLPTSLGGATVTVTDSAGAARTAPLFYGSPTQVNFAIPDGTATGPATIAITAGGSTLSIHKPIVSVAPAVFGLDGVAVGNVLTYPNGASTPVISNSFNVSSTGAVTPAPINVGSGSTQVFLVLYGTGVRNHKTPVTATIGATTATAAFAGAQNVFVGEDQINIPLPQTLQGAGTIRVRLSVDGQVTNSLQIAIQ